VQFRRCIWRSLLEALNIRHSGLDPESRISVWIPAFAGMTALIYANIYGTFRFTRKEWCTRARYSLSGGAICSEVFRDSKASASAKSLVLPIALLLRIDF
jgi:hypothetical protein